jgi:indolepyruvate ferredoxin oxidoreductase beta subunit
MTATAAMNVLITGVGGQGNVVAAHLLGMLAQRQGYRAVVGEMYGLSQRGGSVVSHVRLTVGETVPPLVSQGEAHVIVGLEPLEALRQLCLLGDQSTRVVVNSHPEALMNVMTGRTPAMPVHAIIRELHALSSSVTILDGLRLAHQTGGAKTLNLVMLGALIGSGYLPLQAAGMAGVLAGEFDTDKTAMNMTAFEAGIAAAKA